MKGTVGTFFDVVVVGSGAGGASFALGAVRRGLKVCVVERGAETPFPATPDAAVGSRYLSTPDQRMSLADDESPSADMFVHEGTTVGGSTVAFSGNLLRFHESDFRRKTLLGVVAGADVADWPFGYGELEPYYTLIEEEIGVGGDASLNPFEPPRQRSYGIPPIRSDAAGDRLTAAGRALGWHPYPVPSIITPARGRGACIDCGLCTGFPCTVNARWSARAMLDEARSLGVELRTRCRVTRVLSKTGRATGVEFEHDGALGQIEARAVVLAANAVQTPRLLLVSGPASGLANDSGLVGRNLMTHAHDELVVGGVLPRGQETFRSSGCKVAVQDFYESSPLAVTLEPRALGNPLLWRRLVGVPSQGAPDGPVHALGEEEARERFLGNLTAFVIVEDLPQPDNRVTLGETAADGQRSAKVHYVAHVLDREAAHIGALRQREMLEAAGAEHIFVRPWTLPRFHVFGTCRMGSDPRTSVVDAESRSHELPNLVIADASVFPSSAGVNPALTVLALARRAADKLADAMSRRQL